MKPTSGAWLKNLPRPLRLFAPPEPVNVIALLPDYPPAQFRWRDETHAVRIADGTVLRVTADALAGRTGGSVAVGVRPEKLRLDASGVNVLRGTVTETSYVGVSTQYIVATPAADLVVYVQNAAPGAGTLAPGSAVALSFDPEVAFVVDHV